MLLLFIHACVCTPLASQFKLSQLVGCSAPPHVCHVKMEELGWYLSQGYIETCVLIFALTVSC